MSIDTCALCLKPSILKESHIIPEFLYSVLYDDKHRFMQISTDSKTKTLSRPKGLYERLLCASCEGQIGRWETYAARVLQGGIQLEYQNEPAGFVVRGLEYSHFKLFGMSLLWRAGASTRSEFSQVRLGSRHKENLRRMLLAKDPGPFWQYGFSIVFPPEREAREIFGQALLNPQKRHYRAHHAYLFSLGIMTWIFLVSNHMRQADECIFSLREDGRLRIRSGGISMMNFLKQLSGDLAAANSARAQGIAR